MDGYAVRAADIDGPGPWRLPVDGESRAGGPEASWLPGTAQPISTGGALPRGTDAVIVQEVVRRSDGWVVFDERPNVGQNVRRKGEDVEQGAAALRRGTRIAPGTLALAAMMGLPELTVARRPRVSVLCTGNEIRGVAGEREPHGVPDAVSPSLVALAEQAGADARVCPVARDDAREVLHAIEDALDGTDILVTVGGASVGAHDFVRPALEQAGVSLDFWKVAIKPGKPIAMGRLGRQRTLALPGNPASALITFMLFAMPLLRAMQGDAHPAARVTRVRAGCPLSPSSRRTEIIRGRTRIEGNEFWFDVHPNQSSGAVTSVAESEGVAFLPAGEIPCDQGTWIDFVRWVDA
jgi:molybdopterin molybdotransferase